MGGNNSKKTKKPTSNASTNIQQGYQGNVNYTNNNLSNIQNNTSFGNPDGEAYFKEIAISNDFGNDFGPKEKIQLNFGIKNGQQGISYVLETFLSYEKGNSNMNSLGTTKQETLTNSDGTLTFSLSVMIDYLFEKQQFLQIQIRKGMDLIKLETTVGRIMGSRGNTLNISFFEGASEQLVLSASSLKNNDLIVYLNIEAKSFNYNGMFELFYIVKKQKNFQNILPQGQKADFFKIQKSNKIAVSPKPSNFKQIRIPAMFLCNGDLDYPIEIEFYCPQDKNMIIGQWKCTVNSLLTENNCKFSYLDLNCKIQIVKEPTFIDYLRGGIQLSLSIAIDFTGSNLPATQPNSLHRLDVTGKPNSYQQAIRSCGDILAYYDYDQTFPTFGYGAILSGRNEVSFCFNLNLTENPNIKTIDGVLDYYNKVMPTLKFSGPTFFAPIIKEIMNSIISVNNTNVYNILLILTDGCINDMEDTVTCVVEASTMPLSIIIVGIGYADFSAMQDLDADLGPLTDKFGKKSVRDLVQFVEFNKYGGNSIKLSEEVLAEIPNQVVEYYKLIKKPPGDPVI